MPVFAVGSKHVVRKAAFVAVVMPDCYAMVQSKLSERLFFSNGFVGQEVTHEVDIPHAGKVVNKNGGSGETLLGKFPF